MEEEQIVQVARGVCALNNGPSQAPPGGGEVVGSNPAKTRTLAAAGMDDAATASMGRGR